MVQIDQLQMRIPGIDKLNAAELAQSIAGKIASFIPDNPAERHIPELRIQIKGQLPTDISLAADRIAEHVIREINRLTF